MIFSRRNKILLAVLAMLAGCAPDLSPRDFADNRPEMRPEQFFLGTTRSTGVLQNPSGSPTEMLRVEGHGQTLSDGTFRLEQRIILGQDPPRTRTWILRRVDADHYAGTLTDASGPVEAQAYGNLFHLTYPMNSPLGGRMEQWLYLQPDGRTVLNEATIRVFGFVVAHVSERISRQDP